MLGGGEAFLGQMAKIDYLRLTKGTRFPFAVVE